MIRYSRGVRVTPQRLPRRRVSHHRSTHALTHLGSRMGAALAGAAISTLAFAGTAHRRRQDHLGARRLHPGALGHPGQRPLRRRGHRPARLDGQPRSSSKPQQGRRVLGGLRWPIPTSASMDYTNNSGIAPGMQIVFDVDSRRHGNDNILVGESVYGDNWWLTNSSSADAKAADPSGANNGGNGSEGSEPSPSGRPRSPARGCTRTASPSGPACWATASSTR